MCGIQQTLRRVDTLITDYFTHSYDFKATMVLNDNLYAILEEISEWEKIEEINAVMERIVGISIPLLYHDISEKLCTNEEWIAIHANQLERNSFLQRYNIIKHKEFNKREIAKNYLYIHALSQHILTLLHKHPNECHEVSQ